MTRRRASHVLAILALFVAAALPCFAAESPATAPAVAPAPDPGEIKIWIEPVKAMSIPKLSIDVESGNVQPAGEPLVFRVSLRSKTALSEGSLRMQILDANKVELFMDETRISIAGDVAKYEFRWNAQPVPVGTYTALFSITRPPSLPVAQRGFVVRKVSWNDLQNTFAKIESSLGDVGKNVAALDAEGKRPPYAHMKLAIAEDCVKQARQSMDAHDWLRFERQVHYLERADETVRALVTFGASVPELTQPMPPADMGALEVRDGSFYTNGRPVFLFGQYTGNDWSPDTMRRLSNYGLNFAAVAVGPKDTLAGPKEELPFGGKLDALFKQAAESNIGVAVSLDQNSAPQWARDLAPGLPDNALGRPDLTQPAARTLLERHMAALLPMLAPQKMLAGICLAYEPEFQFTGETVRQGFLASVKREYKTHEAVNQSWRGLFADMDEIAIGWDRDNAKFKNTARYMDTGAYQYDWQTYHQGLGTDYIGWLAGLGRSMAPHARLFIAASDRFCEPNESMFGIDREAVGPMFDMVGVCAGNAETDKVYAIGYPQEAFTYALMRSLNPAKPLLNMSDVVYGGDDVESHYTFDTVHTMLWEAAMSGLDASALKVDDYLANPLCLEAYATAAMDLNRLSEIVQTFQNAPADINILWSMASKIYADGNPYLKSLRFAYEGCSFGGYKLGFITEKQCVETKMAGVKVLVMPETPAVTDTAFAALKEYIQSNNLVIRTAAPILYNEHGHSRRDIINITQRTMLVRGENLPTEFLHAMDAVMALGGLPEVPRCVNESGYPIEGLKTLYAEYNGDAYVYVLNLRKSPVRCWMYGDRDRGRDLIEGRDVVFPAKLAPLKPMLIRLEKAQQKPDGDTKGKKAKRH